MAKEEFVTKNFGAKTLEIITQADKICKEYMKQGYTLTLRQVYYQFVARGLMENKQTEYKRLGSILNDARLAGLIDWAAMEDRTRNLQQLSTWDSPADILKAVAKQFRYDRWDSQPYYCEVWVEKEALIGVIEPVCNKYHVPFFACRGNTSQSELYVAHERFLTHIEAGQKVMVFHLGDHDPNGIDMTRDNADRMTTFLEKHTETVFDHFELERLALNMDQIRQYRPPPNPVKFTDSRSSSYSEKFGNQCWELDALNPTVIGNLIETNIVQLIDDDNWTAAVAREEKARGWLADMSNNWKEPK